MHSHALRPRSLSGTPEVVVKLEGLRSTDSSGAGSGDASSGSAPLPFACSASGPYQAYALSISAPVLKTPPFTSQNDHFDVVVLRQLVKVLRHCRRISGSYELRRSILLIVMRAIRVPILIEHLGGQSTPQFPFSSRIPTHVIRFPLEV